MFYFKEENTLLKQLFVKYVLSFIGENFSDETYTFASENTGAGLHVTLEEEQDVKTFDDAIKSIECTCF